jgi:N-acetylglucosamine transport system permease protein
MIVAQRRRLIIGFLAPATILYLLFVIWPILRSFQYGFFYWQGVSKDMRFEGLNNFIQALTKDPNFWETLGNNAQYMLITCVIILPLSLLIAALLIRKGWPARVYPIVFFAPNVLSLATVAILFMFIYNPILGLLNGFLKLVGLGSWTRSWLVDQFWALPGISFAEVWRLTGFYMLLFLAGIKNIPAELFESARMDGASEVRQFFSITLPMITEMIQIAVVFLIINGLNVFVLPQIMTDGGPGRHTQTEALYMYEQAFKNSNLGYACAMGLLMFVIVLVVSIVSLRLTRGRSSIEY